MLFDIWYLEPDDPRQISVSALAVTPGVICLFDDTGDGIYSWEDLLEHDLAVLQEVRSLDSTSAYQAACDQYEQLLAERHATVPTTATCIRTLLARDMAERYPSVAEFGFDLGVVLLPQPGETTLLQGGMATYALFPREHSKQQRKTHAWPFEPAPCLMTIPAPLDDSAFWGMVASGAGETLGRNELMLTISDGEQAVWARRKEALTEILKSLPLMSFFVSRLKHLFLSHALNNLGAWANSKLGGGEKSVVSLSAETAFEFGPGERVTITPAPFTQLN
ncbi:hypothetical protein HY491_02425 [Candidatus Woesearchaeota archaeon]|nr:hypothetical protein [Candidatus Woesearchaeota archaeon]